MRDDPLKKIRRAALNFLARRDYAETELQRRLAKAGFASEEIAQVTASLIQENLLSNTRFIENYIHFRRKKGFGPLRIRAELAERGLSEEIISAALQAQNESWFQEAKTAWEKRFKKELPEDYAQKARQMRFLQGRGFAIEHIESIFKVK